METNISDGVLVSESTIADGMRTMDMLLQENERLRDENERLRSKVDEAETMFISLMHSAPDVIYRLDESGNISFLSESISEYGYIPDELMGKHFLNIVHPEDRERAAYRINERRTGERSTKHYELRLLTKTNQAVPFEFNSNEVKRDRVFMVSAEGLYDPGKVHSSGYRGTLGIARDITERLVTEEALRESEEKFRTLFSESNDAVFLIDSDGFVLDANRKACAMLGREQAEIVNHPILNFHPETDRPAFSEVFDGIARNGSARFETRMMVSDGTLIDVEVSAGLVNGYSGYVQAIVRDITDRKKAERLILESLEEKEVLMREIHHRVKNNLQVMSSLLSLQAEKVTDPLSAGIFREMISRIQSMGLIHTMLYQSELYSQVDFKEYIQRITGNLESLFISDGGRRTIAVDMESIHLHIDTAIPCGLVINELVSNALKHAFPDGRDGTILITMKRLPDDRIELRVKDNGIGIREDVDIRDTDSLGIMIVRLLVERQLSGCVDMRSGGGTEFVIIFSG